MRQSIWPGTRTRTQSLLYFPGRYGGDGHRLSLLGKALMEVRTSKYSGSGRRRRLTTYPHIATMTYKWTSHFGFINTVIEGYPITFGQILEGDQSPASVRHLTYFATGGAAMINICTNWVFDMFFSNLDRCSSWFFD